MNENEELKKTMQKTIEALDQLIIREKHSERLTKAVQETSKNLEDLQGKLKDIQNQIVVAQANKDEVLSSAKLEAENIIKSAKFIETKSQEVLISAKRREQLAEDALIQAEKLRLFHETNLREVQEIKERLKAALVS